MINNKVMVVDDEPGIQYIFKEHLEPAGYKTFCMSSGEEAVRFLEQEKDIQVFFLDLKLPQMDGIALCKKIKALIPESSIYAITAYATVYTEEACKKAGFEACFHKPFNEEVLLETTKSAFYKLASQSNTKRILIVEDEGAIRSLQKDLLESEGYIVDEAENGFGFGTMLSEKSPDLIVLDLSMPVVDGFTVLENIETFYVKKNRTPPKILVVSAYVTSEGPPKEFKNFAVTDFLAKPFSADAFIEKVKKILG